MITLYTANTPNGVKVTIAMEEIGAPYDLKILNLGENDQKKPDFLKINPNGRIPALVDDDGPNGKAVRVFESGAVLLYLAEKFGKLLPIDPAERIEAIAWAFFQTGGIGPMMGQAGYFKRNHPDFTPGFERYYGESRRLVGVMNDTLETRPFLAGDTFSIGDIMSFGWIDRAPGYFGMELSDFPAVEDWHNRIAVRPGVQKGLAILSPS